MLTDNRLKLILAVALALRLGVVLLFPLPAPETRHVVDAYHYDILAQNIARGIGYVDLAGRPELKDAPGFAYFLAAVYAVFGPNHVVALLLQAVISTFTVLLLYAGAARLLGQVAGQLAAALAALYPDFIIYANVLMTETLCLFFLVAAFAALAWALHPPRSWRPLPIALAGALLGLAALTRPNGLVLAAVVSLLLLGYLRERSAFPIAVMLGLFVLAIGPWTLRNALVLNTFLPITTGGGVALWVGSHQPWGGFDLRSGPRGDELIYNDPAFINASQAPTPIASDRKLARLALQQIAEDPLGYAKLWPRKLWELYAGRLVSASTVVKVSCCH